MSFDSRQKCFHTCTKKKTTCFFESEMETAVTTKISRARETIRREHYTYTDDSFRLEFVNSNMFLLNGYSKRYLLIKFVSISFLDVYK